MLKIEQNRSKDWRAYCWILGPKDAPANCCYVWIIIIAFMFIIYNFFGICITLFVSYISSVELLIERVFSHCITEQVGMIDWRGIKNWHTCTHYWPYNYNTLIRVFIMNEAAGANIQVLSVKETKKIIHERNFISTYSQ